MRFFAPPMAPRRFASLPGCRTFVLDGRMTGNMPGKRPSNVTIYGQISDNTTTNNGGGVYADKIKTLYLGGEDSDGNTTGPTIKKNVAQNGGGLYVVGAGDEEEWRDFIIFQATISTNSASKYGGGMYLKNIYSFDAANNSGRNKEKYFFCKLQNLTMEENTASAFGGYAIYCNNCAYIRLSGKINTGDSSLGSPAMVFSDSKINKSDDSGSYPVFHMLHAKVGSDHSALDGIYKLKPTTITKSIYLYANSNENILWIVGWISDDTSENQKVWFKEYFRGSEDKININVDNNNVQFNKVYLDKW